MDRNDYNKIFERDGLIFKRDGFNMFHVYKKGDKRDKYIVFMVIDSFFNEEDEDQYMFGVILFRNDTDEIFFTKDYFNEYKTEVEDQIASLVFEEGKGLNEICTAILEEEPDINTDGL